MLPISVGFPWISASNQMHSRSLHSRSLRWTDFMLGLIRVATPNPACFEG